LAESLWVLIEQPQDHFDSNSFDEDHFNNGMAVVAWISLRQRGERYQVREFGCDELRISTNEAFPRLLHHALSQLQPTTNEFFPDDASNMSLDLHLPTFLVESIRGDAHEPDWLSNVVSEDDHGWMYQMLGEGDDNVATLVPSDRPHLIWPSDSF
jgi:hypothetical protein